MRSGRATSSNSPSASAAAKLTVSATGVALPRRVLQRGLQQHAAVTPPNGPTMFA